MNKLPLETRVQILSMLCEGSSMRSISRITGVSINTVSKLLVDAGNACAAFHDATVRNVPAEAVQCDEIWSFSYAKQKNVKFAKAAPEAAGRVHKTLGATPAMAAGLVDKVLKMTDVVALIDAREVPAVRGPYKKKTAEISN